jgi:2-methylisocitrate lyase-like PEP mutase family enzyme
LSSGLTCFPIFPASMSIRAVWLRHRHPCPRVSVLAVPTLSMADLAEAGAQRVSLGGTLTWAAVDALRADATAIRDEGDFSLLRPDPPLREWFA